MINSYFSENTLQDLLDEIRYVYMSDERPWIIGYSGGKDSTVVTHLVYTMLKQLLPEERHKNSLYYSFAVGTYSGAKYYLRVDIESFFPSITDDCIKNELSSLLVCKCV